MTDRNKPDSPLVNAVSALHEHLTELERLGGKINSLDMSSDVDVDHVQKLLARFAECGQSISSEVSNLSLHLRDAQIRAESVAQKVSRQADVFKKHRESHDEHLERFRALGEKVRELNLAVAPPSPEGSSGGNGGMAFDIPAVEQQLGALVDELQDLRNSARTSRLKTLEKSAESLVQSLQALQDKLRHLP